MQQAHAGEAHDDPAADYLSGVNRRTLLTGTAALAGKSVRVAILGIAGWLPSKLGVDMSPEFAK